MNFQHEPIKDITNINKGTRDNWDAFEKSNKYHKERIFLQIKNFHAMMQPIQG